jgi:hypothetical protein
MERAVTTVVQKQYKKLYKLGEFQNENDTGLNYSLTLNYEFLADARFYDI